MVIIIRGLPGSGKSVVAKKLKEDLEARDKIVELLHVDDIKNEVGFDNLEQAYRKAADAIQSFEQSSKEMLLIDEVGYSPILASALEKTSQSKDILVKAFMIYRPLKEILAIHKYREHHEPDRVINSLETLLDLEIMIHKQPFKDEVVLRNINVDDTANQILASLEN